MTRRRFWGLLVLVLTLLVLAAGYALRQLQPQVRNVVALAPQDVKQERFSNRLLDAQGDWLRLDVVSDQVIAQGSYSKSASDVLRNRRFVHLRTGEQRSLFPGLGQLLMSPRDLLENEDNGASHGAGGPHDRQQSVYATLYQLIDHDSNADGRLSRQDAAKLIITRPDGRDAVTVLTQPAAEPDSESRSWDVSSLVRHGDVLLLLGPPDAGGASAIVRFNLSTWQLMQAWPVPAPQ